MKVVVEFSDEYGSKRSISNFLILFGDHWKLLSVATIPPSDEARGT